MEEKGCGSVDCCYKMLRFAARSTTRLSVAKNTVYLSACSRPCRVKLVTRPSGSAGLGRGLVVKNPVSAVVAIHQQLNDALIMSRHGTSLFALLTTSEEDDDF